MLREPRGYPAANCNLILPPTHPEADAGFVIMEQVEYPPMSGTNTICVVTVLIETGMVPVVGASHAAEARYARRPDRASMPRSRDGKVRKVTFRNVPAFATHLDAPVEVRGLGTVHGGRRLRRHVLRDRRRRAAGLPPDSRRSPRHRARRRNDQGRRARAIAGGASRKSRASPA